MEKKYNIYIDPKENESIFSSFTHKNPFHYSKEIKKVYKYFEEYSLDIFEFYQQFANEIHAELKKLKKSNYLYESKENKKIGIIKIRKAKKGNNRGKSGGFRIIILFDSENYVAVIISIYDHSKKDNISKIEKYKLRNLCDEYAKSINKKEE